MPPKPYCWTKAAIDTHLAPLVDALSKAGCEIRGDDEACRLDSRIVPAGEQDWHKEYLDAIIALKIVAGVDDAISHIARLRFQPYRGHRHTGSSDTADRFVDTVDSAIVLHNASTQFADGGEFGMGAEIGIATGKMHARGPVGLEQLTSFKYIVRGTGQTRP